MTDFIADDNDNILFAYFKDQSCLCDAIIMFWLTRTDVIDSELLLRTCKNFFYLVILL